MSRDTDNNGISYAGPESWGSRVGDLDYDQWLRQQGRDLTQIDDVLKLHAQHGLIVSNFRAGVGGAHLEDGIDCNDRNVNCILEDGAIGAGRKGVAITNKGGNVGLTFRRLTIYPPYGKHCDIEDGNHSDQSWNKTTGTTYDEVVRLDGQPVRYAWGRADRAELRNGNYRIMWGWSLCLHVYVYLKHWLPWIP